MPNDSENRKRVRWEIIIAAVTLFLAILAYVRPPDPAHPIRFDFLSHTISLPLWVAFVSALGIAAATAAITRWKRNNPAPAGISEPATVQVPPVVASRTQSRNPMPVPISPLVDATHSEGLALTPNPEGLRIESPDYISVQISRHSAGNQKGFTIGVTNERLQAIAQVGFAVMTAQSFDARHGEYRDGASFNSVRMEQPEVLQAGFSGRPVWLVRKEPLSPHLLIGDSSGSPLTWPAADTSPVQQWKLQVAVYGRQWTPLPMPNVPPFNVFHGHIIVRWNRDADEISIQPA